MNKKTTMLIILDGWGHREETKDNAILASKKPNFDHLWATYPHSLLKASGEAVGLPEGQMGNSEVGHMTIGAGKPIDTDLVRIDKEIFTGSFSDNPAFMALFNHVLEKNSTLHVMGLVSPGGVHSHENHLFAFLRLAKKNNIKKLAVHVFLDGRDTPPQSGADYVKELETVLESTDPNYFIASVTGRYYAMDRDKNWDRLAYAQKAIFDGEGKPFTGKASGFIRNEYKAGKKDELFEPFSAVDIDKTSRTINPNDAIFFFNYRADRARMLAQKIQEIPAAKNILLVTMTEFSVEFKCAVAYPPLKIETTLGQEISRAGLKQAHIAETEKFAHATYFLNGGRESPYDGEIDILLASRKDIKTHDQAPEMRATAIADAAIGEIRKGTDFVFINFANPDMVGHTAEVPAIVKAIETVDTELGRIIAELEKAGGIALITADHGNAEINVDPETGDKHTSHTISPVPCILTDIDPNIKISSGGLKDVAPTILDLLHLTKPAAMSGNTLIEVKK
jgi:2,3-bisphosphoglycerate-independent phosphoglycerate mutase